MPNYDSECSFNLLLNYVNPDEILQTPTFIKLSNELLSQKDSAKLYKIYIDQVIKNNFLIIIIIHFSKQSYQL